MSPKVSSSERCVEELREYALSFPDAHEEFPWGERVIKVRKKVFVFLGRQSDKLYLSVKLPFSHMLALSFSFAEPTGYGLGKSGWVTAEFPDSEEAPVPLLREWIEESYRSIAPKKLSALIDQEEPKKEAQKSPVTKKPVAKKKAKSKARPSKKVKTKATKKKKKTARKTAPVRKMTKKLRKAR